MRIIYFLAMSFLVMSIDAQKNEDNETLGSALKEVGHFCIQDVKDCLNIDYFQKDPSIIAYDCANFAIALYLATVVFYENDLENSKKNLCAIFGWFFINNLFSAHYEKKEKINFTKPLLSTSLVMLCKNKLFK